MQSSERIPENLFAEGHYLGKPAELDDEIVARRLRLVRRIPGFCGTAYSLLDIGCGTGVSMLALAPEMRECTGSEFELSHRGEFERYRAMRGLENCKWVLHDIETQALDESYDRIISFEVIEHLRDERSVQRYLGHLRPGGLMAISVPNKWWIFETHGSQRLPILRWNRVPFLSWLPKPIHERVANARIYTKRRIVRLLEDAGFDVLSATYVTAPLDVLPDGRLRRLLTGTLFAGDTTRVPALATAIFVVARRPQGR
jgi:2-polyprenyl-3-methyl-5-hydroxy-6-metoxy-1,4-benzoquinol methylase